MKRSRSSTAADLPFEVIHENILTRLPVKSLLRFKCVSKSWCELIRTPRFVKMHSDQCKNNPKLMLVSFTKADGNIVYSLEYGEKYLKNIVKIPFSGFKFSRILGSCNGLVHVSDENGIMYLWNPSTREYRLVPRTPRQPLDELQRKIMINRYDSRYNTRFGWDFISTYGFGYNAVAKDYEIIKIDEYCISKPFYSQYKIYSLRNKSWGETFQDMSPYVVDSSAMGELINDALHWIGLGHNNSRSIIVFSIGDRKFRELPMPPTSEPRFSAIGIASINGCLSVEILFRSGVEIWMMKDYGVEESWTKLIKFSHQLRGSNPYNSVLKCFAMSISTQNMDFHDMPTCTLEGLLSKLGGGNKKAEQLIADSTSSTIYTETLAPLQGHDYV